MAGRLWLPMIMVAVAALTGVAGQVQTAVYAAIYFLRVAYNPF